MPLVAMCIGFIELTGFVFYLTRSLWSFLILLPIFCGQKIKFLQNVLSAVMSL